MRPLLFLLAATLSAASLKAVSLDDARKILETAAAHKEADQRKEAAIALSLVSVSDPAAKLLETLATDKDYQVRQAAIASIGELRDSTRYPILKAALKDEVPEVAYAAAQALFSVGEPEGKQAIFAVFDEDMKAKSGFFKGEFRNYWRRLQSPKSAMLFALGQGIGFVPLPGVGTGYSAVSSMLLDGNFSPRASTVLMLCKSAGPECDEVVIRGLADDDWSTRAAAVQVVAWKNEKPRQRQLERLLTDKKDRVQFRAAAAYIRLEGMR
jgi:HEAT repeat protein